MRLTWPYLYFSLPFVAVPDKKTRKPSLSVQLTTLRSKGARSASFHPDGSLASVEFSAPEQREPKQTAQQRAEEKVKYVPGTDVPDDKSPLNPLDTILKVPRFDPMETA